MPLRHCQPCVYQRRRNGALIAGSRPLQEYATMEKRRKSVSDHDVGVMSGDVADAAPPAALPSVSLTRGGRPFLCSRESGACGGGRGKLDGCVADSAETRLGSQ